MSVPSVKDSISNWRRRARQCRASATYMTDDALRDSLIATAKSYEAMIAHAQERAKQAEKGE